MSAATFWILAGAVLLVAEMKTGEFTLASIALACLAAAGVAGLGGSFAVQATVAAVMAVVATAALAPMLRRTLAPPTTADPVQAMVGLDAEVLEAIEPGRHGKVKVNGVVWQAEGDTPLPVGARAMILEVLGARLRVMPQDMRPDPAPTTPVAAPAVEEARPATLPGLED